MKNELEDRPFCGLWQQLGMALSRGKRLNRLTTIAQVLVYRYDGPEVSADGSNVPIFPFLYPVGHQDSGSGTVWLFVPGYFERRTCREWDMREQNDGRIHAISYVSVRSKVCNGSEFNALRLGSQGGLGGR